MQGSTVSHKMPYVTLLQLTTSVKGLLSEVFPEAVWVAAEIAELKCNAKGHCYMTLIEKVDGKTVAQLNATIWSFAYAKLSQKFEKEAGAKLSSGIKLLVCARLGYSELYGMSLNIVDIDPTYTVGDMARRRREIIESLTKRGLLRRNAQLPLPVVPQRVAIVSSKSAAGYEDFVNQIAGNQFGYKFKLELFPAMMQGAETEPSVVAALKAIAARSGEFDLIVIMRGGGSQTDLASFDSEKIGEAIALSSLPVVTGIGHEKDETVADLVAHTKCKTPTAVAEFLISGMAYFEEGIVLNRQKLVRLATQSLVNEKLKLKSTAQSIALAVNARLSKHTNYLSNVGTRLDGGVKLCMQRNKGSLNEVPVRLAFAIRLHVTSRGHELAAVKEQLRLLDPVNIIRRGFSLAYVDGHVVTDARDIKPGAVLVTRVKTGKIISSIEEVVWKE